MPFVQFGGITRAILKNPPIHPGWPSVNDPDYARKYDEVSRQYTEKYEQAMERFRQKVNDHLDRLELQHQGERGYFASAEPYNSPGQSLILDGDDYKNFAIDMRLEVQRWLNAFEQIVTGKKARNEEFYRADEDEMKNMPLKKAYNWHNAFATGYVLSDIMKRAEHEVKMRYWQRADSTLEIEI